MHAPLKEGLADMLGDGETEAVGVDISVALGVGLALGVGESDACKNRPLPSRR